MSDMKEYIVTAFTMADADSLIEDMETPDGNLYIPARQVEIAQLRNISRNTHFLLTEEEANLLRNDSRVETIELLPEERDIFPTPHWTQTGNFEKSSTIDTNDKNWGLYRVTAGLPLTNWGTNGTFTQTTQTAITTSSGKNVDVIVVDGHVNPNHPEFKQNVDGTGSSRVNQIDWFTQYSASLGYSYGGTYTYSTVLTNHGTHVAGTVAGNTQGWARDATIYNIEFDARAVPTAPGGNWSVYIFDYIRAFHASKPINPDTGKRNPTIVNNSWGYSSGTNGQIFLSTITSVTYRGVTTAVTGTDANKKTILEANGIPVPWGTYLYRTPVRVSAVDADILDAINDGIIIIASAGNSFWNIATSDLSDYNNSFISSGATYYHSRGSTPGSGNNVITVGSVGTETSEYKSNFSNYGKRVDIWSPGSNITSSVYNSTAASEFGIILADDPRDSNYKLGSISGTSMAGPQVTGYLACVAENLPRLTQSEALSYLISVSKAQVGSSGGGTTDYTSLGSDSNNRYLCYIPIRPITGSVYPTTKYKSRPASGSTYPRPRIRKYG